MGDVRPLFWVGARNVIFITQITRFPSRIAPHLPSRRRVAYTIAGTRDGNAPRVPVEASGQGCPHPSRRPSSHRVSSRKIAPDVAIPIGKTVGHKKPGHGRVFLGADARRGAEQGGSGFPRRGRQCSTGCVGMRPNRSDATSLRPIRSVGKRSHGVDSRRNSRSRGVARGVGGDSKRGVARGASRGGGGGDDCG